VRVLDLNRGVVHQDSNRQRQAAQRHHVDGLAQKQLRIQSDVRIESGMEMQTIRVLRQLPRNSRIIRAGKTGGNQRLAQNALDRGADEDRLIASATTFSSGVTLARMPGSAAFTALTMESVDALPFRVTVIRTPRDPLVRTILFCTEIRRGPARHPSYRRLPRSRS
jgi:hypothetical protein